MESHRIPVQRAAALLQPVPRRALQRAAALLPRSSRPPPARGPWPAVPTGLPCALRRPCLSAAPGWAGDGERAPGWAGRSFGGPSGRTA